ncbi:MAG: nucleotidyltransferase family protein [Bacteroidaceae bacterium]|nr:nucleotidyltransferase family protein [Bacteroidaceae bacterium]
MFFELIRIAIGQQERLRSTPTAEEWKEAYDLAQRQTLTGIAFCGVQRLPEAQRPPRQLLMKWYMAAEQIRRKNEQMDRRTLAVANKFAEEGFPGVVLKGQGVAQLYRVEQIENSKLNIEDGHPEGDARENKNKNDNDNENENLGIGKFSILNSQFSIKEYRTPGDIDIWLFGERKDILRYVRRHVPNCKPVYHHVDFPVIEGLPIEVHFTPSWMNSPFTNRRLQRWFKRTTVNVERGTGNADAELQVKVPLARLIAVSRLVKSCKQRLKHTKCAVKVARRRLRATKSLLYTLTTQRSESNICLHNIAEQASGLKCETFINSKQNQPLAELENQQSMTAINQRPGGAINRAEHFNRSEASLTGTEGASMIPTPTLAFNRVYILLHIYRHLFHEGIGLRQLLDYYFVLHQGFTEEERTETMRTLRSLRMQRFTAAVMWVLQEVFAMDDRYLLTDPNEEEGRFLLSEIMLAGNFGHYDERIKRSAKVTEWGLFCRRVGRNLRFLRSYPSEVLWSPFFKLWHAVFRSFVAG